MLAMSVQVLLPGSDTRASTMPDIYIYIYIYIHHGLRLCLWLVASTVAARQGIPRTVTVLLHEHTKCPNSELHGGAITSI